MLFRNSLKTRYFLVLCGGSLFGSFGAQAADAPFHIIGGLPVEIRTNKLLENGEKDRKKITLHKILPSEGFMDRRKSRLKAMTLNGTLTEKDYSSGVIPFSQSPGAVDLGMNNIPVLDQGPEGTCVTFSTTAAMDALLGKGDFISQQCTLELNKALGNDYWNGAYYASQIIDPLKKYGLVQQSKCPDFYPSPYSTMTLTKYKSLADKTVKATKIQYVYANGITLDTIKTALNNKHRVLIGFGLNTSQDQISVQGFDLNMNGIQSTGGLWACQQPSSWTNYCGTPNAGHEVIIIGYDDNQQLLKIRNSWNTYVGDAGDFYMTYTFFQLMNGDGTEIMNLGAKQMD